MNEITKAPDHTVVNLQEEYNKTDIQHIIDNLEADLVGLKPVKARIREIAALLLIDRLRKSLGMEAGHLQVVQVQEKHL